MTTPKSKTSLRAKARKRLLTWGDHSVHTHRSRLKSRGKTSPADCKNCTNLHQVEKEKLRKEGPGGATKGLRAK